MKIVADEGIAQVEDFQSLGELLTLPAREIKAEHIRDADALVVRSVTKVDKALLQGSNVRFVGTATSGFDHIDIDYLNQQNISFQYAPGSNARSVVEYVFSALATLSQKGQFDWRESSVGIIGAGNIGGLLAKYLRNLGVNYLIYDPYLKEDSEHGNKLSSLSKVLQQDAISLHTPLTLDGDYPSYHLFDHDVINSLSPGKILINVARGAVVDNQALLARLESVNDLRCILDVWENEPEVNLPLLKLVELGTAHIAGYSLTGKLKGMEIIYHALCDCFSLEDVKKGIGKNEDGINSKSYQLSDMNVDLEQFNNTLSTAYNIKQDHLHMLGLLESQEPAQLFDQLRKQYRVRIEYSLGEKFPVL